MLRFSKMASMWNTTHSQSSTRSAALNGCSLPFLAKRWIAGAVSSCGIGFSEINRRLSVMMGAFASRVPEPRTCVLNRGRSMLIACRCGHESHEREAHPIDWWVPGAPMSINCGKRVRSLVRVIRCGHQRAQSPQVSRLARLRKELAKGWLASLKRRNPLVRYPPKSVFR